MYALYTKDSENDGFRYCFVQPVSLFGCNIGYIPILLRLVTPSGQKEPYAWHINVVKRLAERGQGGHALLINLKPNDATNLSLYELADIWGYSDSGWTPILMHLRGLFVDEDPNNFNVRDFHRSAIEVEDPIFSMMYLSGTVQDGNLRGRWTAPRASATNSVLLWPHTFKYFTEQVEVVLKQLA